MANIVINSLDEAIEAALQYDDLGLPVPIDILAFIEQQGVIFSGCEINADEIEEITNG